jgi:predicted DNA-binding protein with PD1-like motif
MQLTEELEIVSITGTLCADGSHIHVSLAKASGEVVGGHLMDGCLVDTTAEIVLTRLNVCSTND